MTYQALQENLLLLQQLLAAAMSEGLAQGSNTPTWQTQITQAEQSFQAALTIPQTQQLEPQLQQRLQSLQTEVSRQLRLVKLDVSFLQATRQHGLQQQRYQQTQAHLADLLRLTDGIVTLLEPEIKATSLSPAPDAAHLEG